MNRLNNSRILIVTLLVVFVLGVGIQQRGLPQAPQAYAGATQNFSGFAWSSNIGWISFNCTSTNTCGTTDYGVNVDSGGNFSGDAWSSIGWISFNETSGCPEAGCVTKPKLDKNSGIVTGWVRACTGTVNGNCTGASRSDGWDGWIKLAGTTATGISYGPTFSTITFTGYSWGSDVIGWISWSGSGYGVVSPANVVCTSTLSASPSTVEQGQSVTLSWSVTGGSACASECHGSGSPPSFDTGGRTSGSATVWPTPSNNSYALICTGGQYGTPPTVNTTITVLVPAITTFTVNNQSKTARVDPTVPNNAKIAWSAANSTSCTVTRNPTASGWPKSGLNSADITDTVTTQTVYKIDCVNSHDTHATASVIVNPVQGFKEF